MVRLSNEAQGGRVSPGHPANTAVSRRLRARLAALDDEIAERQAEREAVARALAPFDAAEWEAAFPPWPPDPSRPMPEARHGLPLQP
jgi:hypothetical protein